MNAKNIIIDCDPGIDDSLALMLALASPELHILGITIVCGNVPVEKGAENALKVLNWSDQTEIPVYLGEEKPICRPYVDAMDTHGEDGLGESWYPVVEKVRPRKDAVAFLAETLRKAAKKGEKISIIALGPMTNLAKLIQEAPDALEGLDELISMGGSYKSHGNCSPVAEYNYWCDPEAAKLVYEHTFVHMIGLDVTRKILLTPDILEYMCRVSPKTGTIIRNITRFYFDFHWKQEGIIGCVINDPLAVAYFLDRSLCTGFDAYTQIETEGICAGQSVVDDHDFYRKKHNSHILTVTDPDRFMSLFFERVLKASYKEMEGRYAK